MRVRRRTVAVIQMEFKFVLCVNGMNLLLQKNQIRLNDHVHGVISDTSAAASVAVHNLHEEAPHPITQLIYDNCRALILNLCQ
jgi:hypothetical protein